MPAVTLPVQGRAQAAFECNSVLVCEPRSLFLIYPPLATILSLKWNLIIFIVIDSIVK